MAGTSKIEWTEATWNPIVGCSIVSPGCTNCYAMAMAARIDKMTLSSHYEGLTEKVKGKAVWTGKLALANEHIFTAPLRRRKPTTYFVNSMGDLFHEDAPDEWIDKVFAVMALAPQHIYQVLTKRAERMREYVTRRMHAPARLAEAIYDAAGASMTMSWHPPKWASDCIQTSTPKPLPPLPNVWLGVSTERRQEAEQRIPQLLATPAAVRFISAEPLLGPVPLINIPTHNGGAVKLDWVIVGGESGPGARPMHPQWARALRGACASNGIPFFFKQWGAWAPNEAAPDRMIVSLDGDRDIPDHRTADAAAGEVEMALVGKKAAGRLLDGVEHNAMPERAT